MKLSTYTYLWIAFLALVGFEYYALNFNSSLSILLLLQKNRVFSKDLQINAEPGRLVSLWLGWLGLGLMIIMNVYSMRKKFAFMQGMGRLSNWLNFHVFCGLLGPTFIFFHCNFKVRGIVGISFWSMIVSFTSGIIGRYFYVQLLKAKVEYEKEVEAKTARLKTILEKADPAPSEKEFQGSIVRAGWHAGIPRHADFENMNPLVALVHSTMGDIRLMMSPPPTPARWPLVSQKLLAEISIQKRRALFLGSFQSLMGYWHTFHFPFAVFMYLAAIIHVTAALVLGV